MKRLKNMWLLLLVAFAACKNENVEFPDYTNSSVYFSYQSPVRTITLGEDLFDTSLDNAYKCQIMATIGGVYENKKDVTINISVNNALTQGLKFNPPDYSGDVLPMPASYYRLADNKITIPKGKIAGGVEVQLTDAYFADPLSTKATYVIPITMTSVTNADSILRAKNYTLYAIKYINVWTGNYLRRGRDVVEGKNGRTELSKTITRRNQYVEKDEIKSLTTRSLSQTVFPVTLKGVNNVDVSCPLLLTFDGNGNCTVTAAATGYTASGTGKFVKRGEKNSWGSQDRDAIYLNYQIEATDLRTNTTDTLVLRDRGVKMETFSPTK
ncbi:DUF5627 domain-containing protein [Mucilaginibacter sp. CSA2-8R]|uniref:DUF5627 domain-containing protein n=1 Tax=Mucilaginibacter sp. CSA2-8R TaxID=3141542 RepID=UPI00315DEA20